MGWCNKEVTRPKDSSSQTVCKRQSQCCPALYIDQAEGQASDTGLLAQHHAGLQYLQQVQQQLLPNELAATVLQVLSHAAVVPSTPLPALTASNSATSWRWHRYHGVAHQVHLSSQAGLSACSGQGKCSKS